MEKTKLSVQDQVSLVQSALNDHDYATQIQEEGINPISVQKYLDSLDSTGQSSLKGARAQKCKTAYLQALNLLTALDQEEIDLLLSDSADDVESASPEVSANEEDDGDFPMIVVTHESVIKIFEMAKQNALLDLILRYGVELAFIGEEDILNSLKELTKVQE